MLIELWERLRGYDRWIETDATISSSQVRAIPYASRSGTVIGYNYASGDVLTWTDQTGEKQYADFNVSDDSPLYQLVGGETVRIRYSPADPQCYYFPALLRARFVAAGRKMMLVLGFLLLFVPVLLWMLVFGRR